MRSRIALLLTMLMLTACGVFAAQTVDHPLHVGGKVRPPIAIYTPDFPFPKAPRTAPEFVARLIVDQQGLPQNVRMIRGMGEDFDKYALEAVRQYRFKPATCNGHPVAVEINIEVSIDPF